VCLPDNDLLAEEGLRIKDGGLRFLIATQGADNAIELKQYLAQIVIQSSMDRDVNGTHVPSVKQVALSARRPTSHVQGIAN
jgi:hypothetical protein